MMRRRKLIGGGALLFRGRGAVVFDQLSDEDEEVFSRANYGGRGGAE